MQMMAMLTNSRNFSTRTEAAKATRVVVPPRFEKRGSPTSRYLLVEIGTPAQTPKPRGKSPGWTKGNTRTKPPRYQAVKKRVSRPKKSSKVAKVAA